MRHNPIPTPADGETDMFRNRLDNMIDMRHELVRLAGLIDWKRFDEAFGGLYAEKGRPGLPTRLMVGLHLLKHARGISDDQVCAQWIENAYFQFFCGETYFQTKLPLDRTSMSVRRSTTSGVTASPCFLQSAFSAASSRSIITTREPPANIASALANPMPDAAPVTTATLPSNSFATLSLLIERLETGACKPASTSFALSGSTSS